jgi:hypothetical protein
MHLLFDRWSFRCVVVAIACCAVSPAMAQRSAGYRLGDRVEVNHMGGWKKAVVVEAAKPGDWVEVKLEDDGDLPSIVPKEAREHFLRQSMPPDRVRSSRSRSIRGERGAENGKSTTASRTGSDRTGKFSVEARFDRLNGEKVVLRKSDGKLLEVPLARLSDADADYVRELQNAADNPFQELSSEPDEPQASDEPDEEAVVEGSSQANWRSVKSVRPQTFAKWSYVPGASAPAGSTPSASGRDAEIALREVPNSERFFEKVHGVHVASDGRRAIIVRERGNVRQELEQHLEDVDLAKGESLRLTALPPKHLLLDAWPDEGLVMYRPAVFGSGSNTLLSIERLDGGALKQVVSWEPYRQERWEPNRDVEQAWFLGPSRVMTINHMGEALTVWDVAATKALLKIPVGNVHFLKMAFSADRKLLAVVMEQGIALIDLDAGRHVATLPADGRKFDSVEFRDNGRQLAGMSDAGLALWDLATGKELGNVYHPILTRQSEMAWAGDYILLAHRYLFDPQRRILLWEYQDAPGSNVSARLANGRIWAVSKGDEQTTLISAALPHPAAIQEAESLPSAEELLVVRPGDNVSIEVDIDPNIVLTDEIRQSLAKSADSAGEEAENANIVTIDRNQGQGDVIRRLLSSALEKAGLNVVDDSKLVLKAVCKPHETQTIRINTDNRWPVRDSDIVERTITPHASYLELSLDGESLWKQGYVASPGHVIFCNQNESLDQALDRLTKPNLKLFANARLSGYVARPGKATSDGAYGVSEFTAHGLVDEMPTGKGGAFK